MNKFIIAKASRDAANGTIVFDALIMDRATMGNAVDLVDVGGSLDLGVADEYDYDAALDTLLRLSITTAYLDLETADLDGATLEQRIRNLGFRKCDRCGAWVTPQDIRSGSSTWDGSQRLCPKCVELVGLLPRERKITLQGYHSTSGQAVVLNGQGENFTLDNVKGIGIEMEFNSRNRCVVNHKIRATEEFYRVAGPRARARVFRCEHDCTVAGEIISNVWTEKSFNDFDCSVLTDQLRLLGNDESIADVGFHVHMSKTWLGSTPMEQSINFLKLQYFLKAYEGDWLKISGRKANEMGWCSFYRMDSIESMARSIRTLKERGTDALDAGSWWSMYPMSHGCALIKSGATVELRIGKSTNDPEKMRHYIRLLIGIFKHVGKVKAEDCYCLGKVLKDVPEDTLDYWRSKGVFLSTKARDQRGFTL